jgi:hypothetical protein
VTDLPAGFLQARYAEQEPGDDREEDEQADDAVAQRVRLGGVCALALIPRLPPRFLLVGYRCAPMREA